MKSVDDESDVEVASEFKKNGGNLNEGLEFTERM